MNSENMAIFYYFCFKKDIGGFMQSKNTQKMMLNLEKWRIEHNLSQAEFSRKLRTSRSNYTKMLNGDISKISADAIKNIYDVTGFLCFELMEIYTDDFLKLIRLLRRLSPEEITFMKQFVSVYLESKGRMNNDN